ncbi:MAG: TVP38/TMEM64 family protein [Cyanobacteriota bacterium]|nr:TVP38/TMEM64 family protein [Cyanobacteriota bacterium]
MVNPKDPLWASGLTLSVGIRMDSLFAAAFAYELSIIVLGVLFMDPMTQASSPPKSKSWVQIGIGLAVAVLFIVVAKQYGILDAIQEFLKNALAWVEDLGPLAPIIFMVIYVLATVLFIPASVLTLGAGSVFGVLLGAFYVVIAATIGANLAFLIGRYVARERVAKMIEGNRKFQAIDQAVGREGWKIIGLIRLSPAFPFNVLNYALGVTKVSFVDNLIGTFGIIPGTFMYVYIGSLLGDVAVGSATPPVNPQAETLTQIVKIVGLLITVGVTVYVTRVAQKALKQSVGEADPALSTEP